MKKHICSSCQVCDDTHTIEGMDGEVTDCICVTSEIPYYSISRHIFLPVNIFYSHEVLECIDVTEFGELTDTRAQGTRDILSCGMVDLNDGKVGRVRLWNWFGAESTTVANLTALMA